MDRRTFVAAMSAALFGSSSLAGGSIALGERSGAVAGQASDSDLQATRRGRTFGSFARLPAKTIKPEGWLGHYAQINADSWLLYYAKSRDPELYDEFRLKNTTENYEDMTDYIGDFGQDLVHYAHMLPDSQIAGEVAPWIQSVLASQQPDGYIGCFAPESRWHTELEVWTFAATMDALLRRYEVTGDKNLLAACERAMGVVMEASSKYFNKHPMGEPGTRLNTPLFFVFGQIGIGFAGQLGKLSVLTGKESYLSFAREYMYNFGKVQAYLQGGDQVVHNHAVIETTDVEAPAYLYQYAGDPQMLKASQAGWEMMQPYLSVAGAPLGGEMLYEVGSRANSEHCDSIFWIEACGVLARTTGEVKHADAAERVMFNDYPAPKSPDGWSLAYMHTPNQLVAAEWSGGTRNNSGDGDMWVKSLQYYSTSHNPLCCNTNSSRGIPLFVESMVVEGKDGLSFLYYGPCTVSTSLAQAGAVGISVETQYPFEDEVRITLRPERAAVFPVQLRVPGWCVAAGIEINGAKYEGPVNPGAFVTISRKWRSGDRIVVRFVNTVRLVWTAKPDSDVRVQCAAVERGPLVYALRVPEQWLPFTPPDHTLGKEDEIKSYRLLPEKNAVWNYALIVDRDHPEKDFELTQLDVPKNARPWDGSSPIALRVKAKRVLDWEMEGDAEHPMTPGFPFNPMKCSEQIETITLVPFGHSRLRMTYLPILNA